MTKSLHQQLDGIRDDIVRLGALVAEAIPRGTLALLDADLGMVQALVDGDDQIDALAWTIEDRCYTQLALQQPMASDMRAIVTAIRLIAELDRCGDLMVNVAKGAGRIRGSTIDPRVRDLIQLMSDEAQYLLRCAMEAYAEHDELRAASLDGMDDALDDLHRTYIAKVLDACRCGSLDIKAAVQLALIGHFYERIGDHAVNVGERVRYMVSGRMPSHHRTAGHEGVA